MRLPSSPDYRVVVLSAVLLSLAYGLSALADEGPHASPSPSVAPAAKPPFHLDWRHALFENMHNKLVHFPIAFGMAAAVILIVSPRWPQYDAAGRALLLVGALFSVAAYFTGDAQKPAFRGTPLWDTAELHETLGTSTAIGLWVGVVITRIRALKPWLWIYAVALVLLISVTGFVGGVLAHTEL